MEIGRLHRIPISADIAVDAGRENPGLLPQLVAAIHGLNRLEFLERGRELKLRRRAGKGPMVDLVDLETGDLLDEVPPEEVLRMMAELEKEREEEL